MEKRVRGEEGKTKTSVVYVIGAEKERQREEDRCQLLRRSDEMEYAKEERGEGWR